MIGRRASSSHLEEFIAGKQTVLSENSTYNFCSLGDPQGGWSRQWGHMWEGDPAALAPGLCLHHCRVHVIGCPPHPRPSHWLPLCFSLQHIPTFVHTCLQVALPTFSCLLEFLFVSSEKQSNSVFVDSLLGRRPCATNLR